MQNVKVSVQGSKLLLEVDLAQSGQTTSKGNALVAGTSDWERLPELGQGWSFNMALVKKPGAQVPAKMALVG